MAFANEVLQLRRARLYILIAHTAQSAFDLFGAAFEGTETITGA